MSLIPVPSADCVGIDVEKNGRIVASYDARDGYVETSNRSHAQLLERTFGSKKQMGFSHANGAKSAPSAACSCACGCQQSIFLAFGKTCRRCRDGKHHA